MALNEKLQVRSHESACKMLMISFPCFHGPPVCLLLSAPVVCYA
jgi:hypothetical protein